MAYLHKWSPISNKSSAGERKHIGQRPMLYHWTTPPTGVGRGQLELQLDVRCLSCCGGDIWWTLTKERQAWCYLQVKLCDPCLSALSVPPRRKKRYIKYSSFPFSFAHTPLPRRLRCLDPRRLRRLDLSRTTFRNVPAPLEASRGARPRGTRWTRPPCSLSCSPTSKWQQTVCLRKWLLTSDVALYYSV